MSSSRLLLILTLTCVGTALTTACGGNATQQSASPVSGIEAPAAERPRNIILMIGDGMGPQQVGMLQLYARYAEGSHYEDGRTAFDRLAETGVMTMSDTTPGDHLVVDSACSATQLATGLAARSETVGVDMNGNPVDTVLEWAGIHGKATGLVTDTRITHATPAAFAAHVAHRSMESDIAAQMLESGVDVLLSGGLREWIPEGESSENSDRDVPFAYESRRSDSRDLVGEAEEAGYDVVFDRETLAAVEADRIIGLFANSSMMDGIRERATRGDEGRTQPSLTDMTVAALDALSADEDGFFLMIEGGQIDWAGHGNDAGWMLQEMMRFEETIEVVREWVAQRNDTLLVVTADHETGGFGFSYSKFELDPATELPGSAFEDRSYAPNFNFGHFNQLDQLAGQTQTLGSIFYGMTGNDYMEPEVLIEAVEATTGVTLDASTAQDVLGNEPNRWYVPDHYYLSDDTTPRIYDFADFYVYGDGNRTALLARALAPHFNTVWATGTHTHTPVPVFATGAGSNGGSFQRFLTHPELGRLLFEAIAPVGD